MRIKVTIIWNSGWNCHVIATSFEQLQNMFKASLGSCSRFEYEVITTE